MSEVKAHLASGHDLSLHLLAAEPYVDRIILRGDDESATLFFSHEKSLDEESQIVAFEW